MSRKKRFLGFGGGNPAKAVQRRRLQGKKPESQRVEDVRKAAGDIIGACFLVAVHDCLGVDPDGLQRLEQEISVWARRWRINVRAVGLTKAKNQLEIDILDLYPGDFVLPVVKPPRNNREWVMLGHQRDAADIFVKLCVAAARRALGCDREQIQRVVAAAGDNFREFGEYAKDGDVYGYIALARRLSQILGEQVDVAEEKGDEPMFGGTID